MINRRALLAAGAASAVGAGLGFLPQQTGRAGRTSSPPPVLNPAAIPKYVAELPIPAAMPPLRRSSGIDEYVIAVRQFRQQILPRGLPATTVWGYGSAHHAGTFGYPARTIEARAGRPVRVTWLNQLTDRNGRYLPHLLPVDPTLHWANPPGGATGRDSHPSFDETPGPYRGPVPMVVHLHGGHTHQESDGYPEAWYLPAARNIPSEYARVGSAYDGFRDIFHNRYRVRWPSGGATFQYPNDQRATTEWFHDHTLGMTRYNVYAGQAGFYLLRGGPHDLPPAVLPGPAPAVGDRPGTTYHEIPLLIQDRSFHTDGSLFYPAGRAFFDGYAGPYVPTTDVPPIWNPEFFANTMVVNGRTWPVLTVQPRRYRLRLLNGCNSRYLILKIAANPTARPASAALPIWQIGSDGGFLPEPVRLERVPLGNGQRADVIVDFTDVPEGTALYLINEGPDGPFTGGTPGANVPPAAPATTGQVMKFVVGPRRGTDTSVPPDQLSLPTFRPLGPASVTRRLSLTARSSTAPGVTGPIAALLGTVDGNGAPVPMRWNQPVTETPARGATEIWEVRNFMGHAHPIHVHQVQFQVVGRGADGTTPPDPGERGYLDTVTALPRQTTRIRLHFDLPGRYVWHCHMLEHEDNEMMRPFQVG